MATGDQADMLVRVKALLPRWFGDATPVLDGLLSGVAQVQAFVYGLVAYAGLQTRIKTASDGWLDVIAADFFGLALSRAAGQSDASLRSRIIVHLFRERATRAGMVKVLTDLTGAAPVMFEPQRPLDTGSYGGPMLGYGVAGGYGSLQMPYQALVLVSRPAGSGIPKVAGYGVSSGGYGMASQAEYASVGMVLGAVTDADIYAAIEATKPVGTVMWACIY